MILLHLTDDLTDRPGPATATQRSRRRVGCEMDTAKRHWPHVTCNQVQITRAASSIAVDATTARGQITVRYNQRVGAAAIRFQF